MRGRRYLRARYVADRVLAAVAIVVSSPLLIAIAVVVKAGDGGPILFRQTRVGEGGRPFVVYKFRTLREGAHLQNDGFPSPDLETPSGAFLRRWSLDELPQLFNILRGEMSFIGPRPTLPDQVARYTPEQRRRLEVRPGLTGWAAVHGRSNQPWGRRIRYDIEYVDNVSLRLDLKILARTLRAIADPTLVPREQSRDQVDDLPPPTGSAP